MEKNNLAAKGSVLFYFIYSESCFRERFLCFSQYPIHFLRYLSSSFVSRFGIGYLLFYLAPRGKDFSVGHMSECDLEEEEKPFF